MEIAAWWVWHCCLPSGPAVAASGWNHAFISFAVGHGPPVVIGSCGLVNFLLPAFLGCLTALPVATGTASHCHRAVMPVPKGRTTHPQENPSARTGSDRKSPQPSSKIPGRGHTAWARTPDFQLPLGKEMKLSRDRGPEGFWETLCLMISLL